MAEQLTHLLDGILRPEFIIFIISMLPVLELRGGLIAAAILGVDWVVAFPLCVLGNILPIPFVLLFINKIFAWLKRFRPFRKVIVWLEERTKEKSKKIETGKAIGLFSFVGIPLPGTGAWTGALVANVLNMNTKRSFFLIAAGVITAGLIVSFISYVIPAWF